LTDKTRRIRSLCFVERGATPNQEKLVAEPASFLEIHCVCGLFHPPPELIDLSIFLGHCLTSPSAALVTLRLPRKICNPAIAIGFEHSSKPRSVSATKDLSIRFRRMVNPANDIDHIFPHRFIEFVRLPISLCVGVNSPTGSTSVPNAKRIPDGQFVRTQHEQKT
jgi:hypothetical protein